jgi:hypothetical protein
VEGRMCGFEREKNEAERRRFPCIDNAHVLVLVLVVKD